MFVDMTDDKLHFMHARYNFIDKYNDIKENPQYSVFEYSRWRGGRPYSEKKDGEFGEDQHSHWYCELIFFLKGSGYFLSLNKKSG